MSHLLRTLRQMAVRVEWVRYGRAAADALRVSVAAAKGDDPLRPVTVVVPSNHVGVATRRLLASGVIGSVCGRGVGLAAVSFVTPHRLAELLGAADLAGAGRRPVSTPVVAAAIRAALERAPGVFAPVAQHAATETALVVSYRELRDLSAGALDGLAAASVRAADVVRLHREARARLEVCWYDEQDLLDAAARAVDEGRSDVSGLGAVIAYLPQRLSRHAARLLASLDARSNGLLVLAGTTGDPAADVEVVASIHRLGASLSPSAPAGLGDQTRVGRCSVVTVSDADDEVRAAVRAVVDGIRQGTPLDRIAVLYATSEPYARLIHEQLAAAGVAVNGASVVPVARRMAGRALLQLLALPSGGFKRHDLFAWLTSVPVLHEGQWAPVAAWERVSRTGAVVSGTDWDHRLATVAASLDAEAEKADADAEAPAWLAYRHRDDAASARSLRSFVMGLMQDHATADAERGWAEHVSWARGLLERIIGGEDRRLHWPIAERKAAERVGLALDRLAALDSIEEEVGLDVFARTLQLELESDIGRVGRFGEGVLVGPVAVGLGLDLDVVVVLGLAEGSFPSPVRDDSLLPDHERAGAAGELPLMRDRVARQHRELLGALASAAEAVLCVPRGDLRRSSRRVPSRWALDAASSLAGRALWSEDLAVDVPGLHHVASFDAGIRSLASPATEQEHRLRSLLARTPVVDAVVSLGNESLASRRSDQFTRFDGNLAGLSIPSPVDEITSPTRLERWADCPFAYLLEAVLRVRAVENPEDHLTITHLDRGSLVHDALERFVLEVLARPPSDQPVHGGPWSAGDRARLAAIGEEVCSEYEARGLCGRPIFWRRDRRSILADLVRFLDEDDAYRRQHGTRPVAAELEFGFAGSTLGPVALELPDGRSVRFRGKADRLDVGIDGARHVVDYKTGKPNGYVGLCEADPDLRGKKLQLAVYGAAGRLHAGDPDCAVRADYWFVTARGRFDRVGYSVDKEILERVGATLGTIVTAIESGVFPPHPTASSTSFRVDCDPCDPDALGVIELRRHWDRKRLDPLLAVFADFAEPAEA